MSIEMKIRQKGILKKEMPLEIIVGKELRYGRYDGLRLEQDALGETEFIAYHPAHIGRGICVTWKQGEKDEVGIRILMPACDEELEDLYGCVERITQFWKHCEIELDSTPCSLEECLESKGRMLDWNQKLISCLGEEESLRQAPLMLFCAFWPLSLSVTDLQKVSQGSAFSGSIFTRNRIWMSIMPKPIFIWMGRAFLVLMPVRRIREVFFPQSQRFLLG